MVGVGVVSMVESVCAKTRMCLSLIRRISVVLGDAGSVQVGISVKLS